MSRAEDLFRRLEAEGLIALEAMIADYEPESLFLDFKRAHKDGALDRLADSDNKNLSRCISGFANSEGGLVVWGVDCRRDASLGREVASIAPLVDALGFRTRLEDAVTRSTVPPHQGVRMIHFLHDAAGLAGFVAMLIPKSKAGPVRDLGEHKYQVRAGSSFSPVSHDVLAGMFGRTPQPSIALVLTHDRLSLTGGEKLVEVDIAVSFFNDGGVLARRAYFSVQHPDLPTNLIRYRTVREQHDSVYTGSQLRLFSYVANEGNDIPPGGIHDVCGLVMMIPVNHGKDVRLECMMGALHAPPIPFTMTAEWEALEPRIASLRAGARVEGASLWKFDPPFESLSMKTL